MGKEFQWVDEEYCGCGVCNYVGCSLVWWFYFCVLKFSVQFSLFRWVIWVCRVWWLMVEFSFIDLFSGYNRLNSVVLLFLVLLGVVVVVGGVFMLKGVVLISGFVDVCMGVGLVDLDVLVGLVGVVVGCVF